MKDIALARTIREILSAAFDEVYVGSPVDAGVISMPAILLDIHSTSTVGSLLYRGTLTVAVNSIAETATEEEHRTLSEQVDASVRNLKGISGYGSTLSGIVATNVSNRPVERHWVTMMEYTVGFF
jgi:hypothetical protein